MLERIDLASADDELLVETVAAAQRQAAFDHLLGALAAGELSRRASMNPLWSQPVPSRTCVAGDELAMRLGWSRPAAARLVRDGRALAAQLLPVADAVRGILDGHVILDRRIAEGGRYPAIDVLRSLSRAAAGCLDAEERALIRRARAILALHGEMADLVRLGAYRAGTDPAVDEAVALAPRIEAMLRQGRDEATGLADSFSRLREAVRSV